ncbi:MAG: type II toxin-antitoxin system PemK/MazF family toxin [Candidatus Jacksonbacteria bacterium]
MRIRQGDIYLANLNPTQGHEQAGFRPILVIQNNTLNTYLKTVIIAPITSNLKAQGKLTTYFLSKNSSKLSKDSIVLLFQLRTLDKKRLQKKIHTLNPKNFLEIKKQLRFVF